MVDLMQGQYKGTVQCAECKYEKHTFEPFTTVQLPIPHLIRVEFFFMAKKPQEQTFQGEIPLLSLQTDEPLMNIKLRMAVQASEFYKRNISAYDFVLALILQDSFSIVTLINDEAVATFRQLEWNPNTQFLIAFEVNTRALVPGYSASLASNFIESHEIPLS